MNWQHTTLLHEMARLGEIRKATLLLDRGADIDAVDQEFQSTPLGFAARWGQRGNGEAAARARGRSAQVWRAVGHAARMGARQTAQ